MAKMNLRDDGGDVTLTNGLQAGVSLNTEDMPRFHYIFELAPSLASQASLLGKTTFQHTSYVMPCYRHNHF
jgi:hypothetical protein